MAMNQYLAMLYGTDPETRAAIEQAEILEKVADDADIDLSDLTDEQIDALAAEVFGDEEDEDSEYEAEGEDDDEEYEGEEDEERELLSSDFFRANDFAGRQMAHAFVDELNSYGEQEKQAGALSWIKNRPSSYRQAARKLKAARTGTRTVPDDIVPEAMTRMERLRALGGAAKKVAPEAALVGGGGAATIAALKKKGKKKESAYDEAVEGRALEIIQSLQVEADAQDLVARYLNE